MNASVIAKRLTKLRTLASNFVKADFNTNYLNKLSNQLRDFN